MPDVFISYTRDERARCVGIGQRLQALGLDVWFDAKLASGTSFDTEIETNIRAAKAVMVLWSPKSVQSTWVRNEATIGQQRNVLVSVEIERCTLPVAFTNTHTELLLDETFSDDDPAWINILTRLAQLTGHPSLFAYRNLAPRHVAPRKRGNKGLVVGSVLGLLVTSAAAVGGWYVVSSGNSALIAAAPLPTDIADATETASPTEVSTVPALPPDVQNFANTLTGQWALRLDDCPDRKPGLPVDMTPSAGPWLTVRPESMLLKTTSLGRTAEEQIVGLQNGWLQTFAEGENQFYQLNESGRLMVRVGDGESQKLEPCI